MKVNGGWWDKIVIKLKCCEQLGSQVVEIKIYLYNFCFGVESLNYDSMIFLKLKLGKVVNGCFKVFIQGIIIKKFMENFFIKKNCFNKIYLLFFIFLIKNIKIFLK